MNKILKIEDIPLEDKVYLKKDIFGYRVVNPIKNEDGTFNFANLIFGGYRNLLFLIILLLLLFFSMWSYNNDIQAVKDFYGNISVDPFYACKELSNSAYPEYSKVDIKIDGEASTS